MAFDDKEFPYVVRVKFSGNQYMYYNSYHYLLRGYPGDGTRYKTMEAAEKDIDHATSQGGTGKVVKYDHAIKMYRKQGNK